MSTDFERYILRQRPFCSVTDCMRPSRYVLDAHGGNMRVVCARHDPEAERERIDAHNESWLAFTESFSDWLDHRPDEERGSEQEAYTHEEAQARRRKQ